MILHPGGNAQAMLTWRVNVGTATPFNPSTAHVTPPDEYAYLWSVWQGGPVLGGNIVAWPLRAAPAGPFPGRHRHHREPVQRHVRGPGQ